MRCACRVGRPPNVSVALCAQEPPPPPQQPQLVDEVQDLAEPHIGQPGSQPGSQQYQTSTASHMACLLWKHALWMRRNLM